MNGLLLIEDLIIRRNKRGAIIKETDQKRLDDLRISYYKSKTEMIRAERYRCLFCDKLFVGEAYVFNHIENRHMSYVIDDVDKKFYSKLEY